MNEICICCGHAGKWIIGRKLPGFLFDISFSIDKCPSCGLGKTTPQPKINTSYYEANERYNTLFIDNRDLYLSYAQELLDTLNFLDPKNKKLLDIGSGGGFVVEYANILGFDAEGIELNAKLVKWCQKRGLKISQLDILKKDSFPKDEKYDVIVLSDILEHLHGPEQMLAQTKKLLNKDGLLLISQASYDGFLPRIFPWGWYAWQPKEHYWHFTPDSFIRLVESVGLEPLQIEKNSLHHPWFFCGGIKIILGRNLAALLARIGNFLGQGDSFYALIRIKDD